MCNNCDPVGQALSTIARHGWSITAVGAEGHEYPAFAYTSGLTARGCPELLCYGLPPHTSGRIINGLAERFVAGMRVDPGARVSEVLGNGLEAALVEVVDPSDMLVTGALYSEFSAIQDRMAGCGRPLSLGSKLFHVLASSTAEGCGVGVNG